MDLTHLLRRAGEITWRYKPLWALGIILAALGGQNPASSSFNFNYTFSFNLGPGRDPLAGIPDEALDALLRLAEWLSRPAVLLPLVCGGLAVGLIFLAIASLAEGALVNGAQQAESGAVDLGRALTVGRERLWSVFVIRLLIGVSVAVPLLLALLPIFGFMAQILFAVADPASADLRALPRAVMGAFGLFFLCFLPLMCVFILVSILLSWLEVLSIRAIVVEQLGVLSALRRAWQLLRANWLNVFLIWILLLAAQGVLGTVIGLPLGVVGSASALPAFFTFIRTGELEPLTLAPVVVVGGLILLITVAVGGVLLTYISSLWTLAYQQFTGGGDRV